MWNVVPALELVSLVMMFFEGVDVKGNAEGRELMVCSATRSRPT
jgi:hypothetical protein